MLEDKKKPLKTKNLKIIDHIGTLYATLDGNTIWEMDSSAYVVIKMCNGTKSLEQISKEIAKKTKLNQEDVKNTVRTILDELERLNFIDYV